MDRAVTGAVRAANEGGKRDTCNRGRRSRVLRPPGPMAPELHSKPIHPMNRIIPSSLTAAALLLASSLALRAAEPLPGFVDFGAFAPDGAGSPFVEVNVGPSLIGLVARLAEKAEPEVTELLRGLKSVRVNVIGISDANRAELDDRLRTIRADLTTRGWERVVSVQDGKQDVGVYLKQRGDEAIEGLVVTVMGAGKEAVFVNIVGDIRPEKIAVVAEKLNIAPLKKVTAAFGKS